MGARMPAPVLSIPSPQYSYRMHENSLFGDYPSLTRELLGLGYPRSVHVHETNRVALWQGTVCLGCKYLLLDPTKVLYKLLQVLGRQTDEYLWIGYTFNAVFCHCSNCLLLLVYALHHLVVQNSNAHVQMVYRILD